MPLLNGTVAEGAPAGEFALRNAFGLRVLRCGYTLAPGSWWWPSRVILDGVDVTNVPTDFSEHENGRLEIVFTQHPARIAGTVTDAQGRRVTAPWIMVTPADRASWQHWATTSIVGQGDPTERFSIPALPGQYRVNALPQTTFHSWGCATGYLPVRIRWRHRCVGRAGSEDDKPEYFYLAVVSERVNSEPRDEVLAVESWSCGVPVASLRVAARRGCQRLTGDHGDPTIVIQSVEADEHGGHEGTRRGSRRARRLR
jgi:hypothetical protein